MKRKIVILFILTFTMIMVLISCKKKTKTEPVEDPIITPPVSTGTFIMHLHTFIEDNEVDGYNIVYTTDAGRKFSISKAQMYISNIQLVRTDGTVYDFPNNKILKLFESTVNNIGTAPVGNYKSIRFKVGLDAATNQLSSTTPSDSSLLNKPAMWFGANAQPDGYVFMNVQGKIDTTSDYSGTIPQMQPFVYKIGTNANYMQVNMPDKNFTIVKDQAQFGHIIIDYTKLFNGVQLNQSTNLSVTTASANGISPATTIANNIPLMFRYEL